MITIETIPIQLKINSAGSINTGRYFGQNDNGVGKLVFTVFREDGTEIDYSEVSQCYLTLKYPDGTFMEPCQCDIGSDSLSYELCAEALSHIGTITGLIKMYGEEQQVFTSNIFRFVVIADQLNGCTLADEAKVSLINELISQLTNVTIEEDIREANELSRILNESNRIEAENNRAGNEDSRIESETERVLAEVSRVEEFDTIKSDYTSLVATVMDNLNHMIIFDIPSLKNPPDEQVHKILFSIPSGYVYTITGLSMISKGESAGINELNTSQIQLIEGEDIISDILFNDVNLFPSENETKVLTVIDGLIDKDNDVYIKVINGAGVTTPEFSLQINYDIEKIS